MFTKKKSKNSYRLGYQVMSRNSSAKLSRAFSLNVRTSSLYILNHPHLVFAGICVLASLQGVPIIQFLIENLMLK